MDVRRRILIGSVSVAAMAVMAAAPAFAADAPADQPGEVVITGIRESLQRAIEMKKDSDVHIDAISAEDIGKLPDMNVADALQRIPGVNTSSAASGEGGFDENDRVSIRGTSPSLTQVTVDGHSVSTGDWFILDQFQTVGRSISFALFPSEFLQATKVYKTQSADLLEGGVAGAIDMISRRPLDFGKSFTFQGAVQGAWGENAGQVKPQVSGLAAWKNNSGTFGALIQGFYEERAVERYGQETLGYTSIGATDQTGITHPDLVGVSAPTLIGSSWFRQTRKREGGDFAIEYRPNDQWDFDVTGFYSNLNASNVNNNYMLWGSHEVQVNAPTSYTVKDNTLVSAVFPRISPTGAPVQGIIVDNIVRPDASGQSWYVNFDAAYHPTARLALKGQVGYTRGVGKTPSQPAYEVFGVTGVSYQPSGNGWQVTPSDINPQSPAGLVNDWSWNETFTSTDKELYGKIDGDWDLTDRGTPFQHVLFGVRADGHEREVVAWDRGCSLGSDGQCWTAPPQPYSAVNPTSYPSGFNAGALGIPGLLIPIAGDPNKITSILNGITDGVHGPISSIVQPLNYYWPGAFTVKERDYAGYVEAKVGGDGWRGNFGVRVVSTNIDSYVNVSGGSITSSAYGPYSVDKVSHTYVDFLPSANFSFDLNKKLLLRISAAETMSRPDYSALGGSVSLTDTILTGNGGNPDLKPIKAAVYDASLEWYYAPTSLAAVSVFYDDLSSYVAFGNHQAVYFSEFWHGNKTFTITSPINTSGEVKGVELQLQQPLPYGFGFQANATYVDSHDRDGNPLVGTSKWTANLVGYYENRWVSARLAYTYRSHFFVGLDRSSAENQDNYGSLDGSLNFNINRNIALTVDALNLTNSKMKYYADSRTQPRAVYDNGRQVFFGVHVKY